jgi:anti-sigma regulatory factor (Ser/Thr protein kinase)
LFFELTYANAGHPYPLLRKPDGSVQMLLQNDAQGDLPLGLRQRNESTSASISVEPGSLLTLYTDGLTELQRDPIGGEKKLLTCLQRLSNLRRPAPELYRSVLGDQVQHDDVAILMVSFERALADMQEEGLVMRWEFDANNAEIAHAKHRAFVSLLERVGFTATELSSAELVFGELLGNVVRYAGGRVTMLLDMSTEAPVLHVLDCGHGFEHNRRLPKDLMSEHGRGLFLVTAFAEEVGISRRKDGGSHARIVLSGRIRSPLGPQIRALHAAPHLRSLAG